MALRFLDHHVRAKRSERKCMHCVLCTNAPWTIHVIQRLPLSSGCRISSGTGSKVDGPPSNSGRCLEIVMLRATFSLVCVPPRNRGWRLNSQLAGTLLAIHGRQQCPISGKRGPCVKRRVLLTIGLGVWLRDTRFAADIQKDSCPKLAEESRAAIGPP